jgi:DNA repair protein RecO (recombination protein O)
MSTYRTEGVILRRTNFGEANLLVQVFTRDHGKVEASARSARKPCGKLKGLLEPFLYCDFMIVHGKKMDTVANSFVLDSFLGLRHDLDTVLAASAVTDIANRMILTGYKDERVFSLLVKSLSFLDEVSVGKKRCLKLLVLFFELNILSLLGFTPSIQRCVFCGERLRSGNNYFSNSLGGVLDEECGKKCPDAVRADDNTIRLLKFLQLEGSESDRYEKEIEAKLALVKKLKVEDGVLGRSIILLKNFIEFNLDQKVGSLDIFCNFVREEN